MRITHGSSPVPTKMWSGPGRAVDEVPGAQRPLLLLDQEQAGAGEHEEVLLAGLPVVQPGRLAGLEDGEREPGLPEPLRLEVRSLGEHAWAALEHAPPAERVAPHPCRLAGVDHE